MEQVNCSIYDNKYFYNKFSDSNHVINRIERSILPDLKYYSFPDEIKNQADVIYNKMRYQVRRGKIRQQLLFFCVYCAHLELGYNVNPVRLGEKFGLTQGEVQKCDSLFSPLQTGYKPPVKYISPLNYLPEFCKNIGFADETINDVISVSESILNKDSSLTQENPQTVAAGLLRYYILTHGVSFDDLQRLTTITNRSIVTIDGMFRKICMIDNK
ncbi:MAG: hypothetical protein QW303_03765 [Nitrososphaerota archaeon]